MLATLMKKTMISFSHVLQTDELYCQWLSGYQYRNETVIEGDVVYGIQNLIHFTRNDQI